MSKDPGLERPLDLEERLRRGREETGVARLEEEAHLEIVHLPEHHRDQHADLQDGPPLHAVVGGLGGVAVRPLADDDVLLLVLDSCEAVGKGTNLALNGSDDIGWGGARSERANEGRSCCAPSSLM